MSRSEGGPNRACRERINASSSLYPITPQAPEHDKRFEQTPDSNVSAQSNSGFYVYVWSLRASRPLRPAQLKTSVMLPMVVRETPVPCTQG